MFKIHSNSTLFPLDIDAVSVCCVEVCPSGDGFPNNNSYFISSSVFLFCCLESDINKIKIIKTALNLYVRIIFWKCKTNGILVTDKILLINENPKYNFDPNMLHEILFGTDRLGRLNVPLSCKSFDTIQFYKKFEYCKTSLYLHTSNMDRNNCHDLSSLMISGNRKIWRKKYKDIVNQFMNGRLLR